MKVLVVSSKYPPEYSGSGLRAHNTYKRLSKKFNIHYDVVASSVTYNQNTSYCYEGIRVTRIANKAYPPPHRSRTTHFFKRLVAGLQYRYRWQYNYWREAIPMFRFLQQRGQQYDLIHVFGNAAITSAAVIWAKIVQKPLIVELVNLKDDPNLYEPKLVSAIWRPGYPSWALIVCLSKYLRDICLRFGYTENQLWTRPNPIDEHRFYLQNTESTPCPQEWRFNPSSARIILHLAKFIPRKHQDFMIDVLPYLPENYKLVMAGPLVETGAFKERDHRYFREIVETIKKRQLEHRVQLIPKFIKNPENYIRASDVFVLPSEDEAFGTPIIEAIACGIPVVTNDIPNVFDQWIQPGINGFICELKPEAWATSIQKAVQIDKAQMEKASKQILSKASTSAIDEAYYRHLQQQIAKGPV